MTDPKPPVPSRWDWQVIARRINRAMATRIPPGDKSTLDVKGLAYRVGMSEESLRKKLGNLTPRGRPARTPFTIEECGRIAELYRAPGFWPFEDWK